MATRKVQESREGAALRINVALGISPIWGLGSVFLILTATGLHLADLLCAREILARAAASL